MNGGRALDLRSRFETVRSETREVRRTATTYQAIAAELPDDLDHELDLEAGTRKFPAADPDDLDIEFGFYDVGDRWGPSVDVRIGGYEYRLAPNRDSISVRNGDGEPVSRFEREGVYAFLDRRPEVPNQAILDRLGTSSVSDGVICDVHGGPWGRDETCDPVLHRRRPGAAPLMTMTTQDIHGNLHNTSGRFTEKTQPPAPDGPEALAVEPAPDRGASEALRESYAVLSGYFERANIGDAVEDFRSTEPELFARARWIRYSEAGDAGDGPYAFGEVYDVDGIELGASPQAYASRPVASSRRDG
ncbi:hypothetical protein BH09ACT11_BH09ACT11_07520 [soil metagenome]